MTLGVGENGRSGDKIPEGPRFSVPVKTGTGPHPASCTIGRLCLKCDGTRAETRFCLSAKWTSPFKSAGASVQSTTGSRGMRISGSNAGYTKFRGSEGYWLPTPFASFPFTSPPCVTVCHYVSTGLYQVSTGDKTAGRNTGADSYTAMKRMACNNSRWKAANQSKD